MGMKREEVLQTRFGEMQDLLSCYSVMNGNAKIKRKLSYIEAMRLE